MLDEAVSLESERGAASSRDDVLAQLKAGYTGFSDVSLFSHPLKSGPCRPLLFALFFLQVFILLHPSSRTIIVLFPPFITIVRFISCAHARQVSDKGLTAKYGGKSYEILLDFDSGGNPLRQYGAWRNPIHLAPVPRIAAAPPLPLCVPVLTHVVHRGENHMLARFGCALRAKAQNYPHTRDRKVGWCSGIESRLQVVCEVKGDALKCGTFWVRMTPLSRASVGASAYLIPINNI